MTPIDLDDDLRVRLLEGANSRQQTIPEFLRNLLDEHPTQIATNHKKGNSAVKLDVGLQPESLTKQNKLANIKQFQIISELMCDYAAAYRFTSDDLDNAQLEWVIGAFEEITGISTQEAFTNFSLSTPVHPEDKPIFQERQRKLKAGQKDISEFRIFNKQGEIRHLIGRGFPEWDNERQKISRIYVGIQDITDRRKAEEKLRISEAKYRHLLETSVQGIVLFQDGRFVYCNPSMSKITGYTVEQMLKMSPEQIANLVHPEDREQVQSNVRRRLAGLPVTATYEHRLIRSDGEVRHVEIYASLAAHQGKAAIQSTYLDVTERRRIQEAYYALVDNALQGLMIYQDGRIAFANAMTSEITGYSNAELTAMEDSIASIIHPDSHAIARKEAEKLLNGKPVADYELCIITKQREERWIRSIGTRINYRGRSAIQVAIVDITKQRLVEKELTHAAAIIQSSDDAIIGKDLDGIILSWNPGAEQIYGYKAAEVIGRPITLLIPPDFPNDVPAILDRIRRGESVDHYETVRKSKDGRILNISLTISPIRDENNRLTGASVIARDITSRKKIEKALRENEAQQRQAVLALQESEGRVRQAMHVGRLGIWDWIIETDETIWMGDMFRMYGIAPEEFTGKGDDYLNYTLPEDQQIQRDNIARAFERGITEKELIKNQFDIPHHPNQFRILRPDGSICHVQGDTIAIIDEEGNPIRMIGVLQDISEQKNIESAMLQAQKLESLGVLAGSVAHDFNNLLTGILTHATLIKLKLGADSRINNNLNAIIETSERAAKITNQLLAYTGRGRFQLAQINLNDLVTDNLTLLLATLPKNITLNFKSTKPLPPTDGDLGQIQQVVMNLVINAADAYEGRAGHINIKTSLTNISPKDVLMWEGFGYKVQPGSYLSLVVKDSGQGMDEKTLTRIFDPFFTTKEQGRGLGLAAVQGIIRGHHGALRVISQTKVGTTFKILLPVSEKETPSVVEAFSSPSAKSENNLILVVDDEEAIRNATSDVLTIQGYEVLTAENGEKAITLCQQYAGELSLILLDMTMPVLSGLETIRTLHQNQLIFPVIMMSGYDDEVFEPDNQPANVVGFLKKPFRIEQLLNAVVESLHINVSGPQLNI